MLAILTEWLKDTTRSVGIGSNVVLAASGDSLAARSVEAGETLLELRSGACLTARAAYADREMGRDLLSIAERIGPGFDTEEIGWRNGSYDATYKWQLRVQCFVFAVQMG